MEHEIRPIIEGDAPFGHRLVDEVAISASEVEYTAVGWNESLEIVAPQRTPYDFPFGIGCKPRLMIAATHRNILSVRQPKTIPVIIRQPTWRALRLLTFPPLLTPTRW